MLIMPADPDKNDFKRDVALIVKGLKVELKKEKPVEEHIFSFDGVENRARVICRPTFTLKYSLRTALALADHGYCSTLFDADTISIEKIKIDKINFYIDKNNGSIQTDDTNIKTNNTGKQQ